MRVAYAHEAVIGLERNAGIREPGAAITAALCGHWEHDGPCPLAPHHTSAIRVGGTVHLRVLFATEPENEADVRGRIHRALAERWPLLGTSAAHVSDEEAEHAARLVER